jgi:hypothetical protein
MEKLFKKNHYKVTFDTLNKKEQSIFISYDICKNEIELFNAVKDMLNKNGILEYTVIYIRNQNGNRIK